MNETVGGDEAPTVNRPLSLQGRGTASRLFDDYLKCRDVPRLDGGIDGQLSRSFGYQRVLVEVSEAASSMRTGEECQGARMREFTVTSETRASGPRHERDRSR